MKNILDLIIGATTKARANVITVTNKKLKTVKNNLVTPERRIENAMSQLRGNYDIATGKFN